MITKHVQILWTVIWLGYISGESLLLEVSQDDTLLFREVSCTAACMNTSVTMVRYLIIQQTFCSSFSDLIRFFVLIISRFYQIAMNGAKYRIKQWSCNQRMTMRQSGCYAEEMIPFMLRYVPK